MRFLNEEHEKRYNELIEKGEISQGDEERKIVMFVFAGNEALYKKAEELYDFKDGYFKFDLDYDEKGNKIIKWLVPLSSSERVLATLAFDIFSANNNVGVHELFRVLDSCNTRLALNAIAEAYLYS